MVLTPFTLIGILMIAKKSMELSSEVLLIHLENVNELIFEMQNLMQNQKEKKTKFLPITIIREIVFWLYSIPLNSL